MQGIVNFFGWGTAPAEDPPEDPKVAAMKPVIAEMTCRWGVKPLIAPELLHQRVVKAVEDLRLACRQKNCDLGKTFQMVVTLDGIPCIGEEGKPGAYVDIIISPTCAKGSYSAQNDPFHGKSLFNIRCLTETNPLQEIVIKAFEETLGSAVNGAPDPIYRKPYTANRFYQFLYCNDKVEDLLNKSADSIKWPSKEDL